MRQRSTHTIRTEKQERKQANTIFNEVRQFAYVLEARGRDFIDSTINYDLFLPFKEFPRGIFREIQFMRALTLIARESQSFRKPRLDSTPI